MPVDPIVAQRLWTQPELSGLNRLPMRPPLVPYPDLDQARTHDPSHSPGGARSTGTGASCW